MGKTFSIGDSGKQHRQGKGIADISIYWSHIQKDEKTGLYPPIPAQNNVQCKILYSFFRFFTPNGSCVWFDQYLGIAPNNDLLFAFSMRRFEPDLTVQEVIKVALVRIPDFATREFVLRYAFGCRMEIMGIYEIKAAPMELEYKKFV